MVIFVNKKVEDSELAKENPSLKNEINKIPEEKLKELVEKVADVAVKHNKSLEQNKNFLRYNLQVAPERIEDGLLSICGADDLYSFEVSMVADKVEFKIFATVMKETISREVQSEEMKQVLHDFLKDNIENFDDLLKEEIENIEAQNNEIDL